MPHDKNGRELRVGDCVNIPARVTKIEMTEEYCNVTLSTRENMPPYETPTTLVLNTRQVEACTG